MKYTRTKQIGKEGFYLVAGVLSAGLGLKGFLLPNNFLDGGVTGISLLISELSGISISLLIFIINIPFIIIGYWQISKMFALKTLFAIAFLSLALIFIEYPIITSDKLLIAIFGGFFLGMGIGLAIRGGGVLDGTEVLAIYVSRQSSLSVGDVMLVFNIIIFSFAVFLINIETALYAILTYLAASKTVDFLIHGIEEYTGVTIISPKSEPIRVMILAKLGRGVTIYKGRSGIKDTEIDIIYTIVTRLEVQKLKNEIQLIDEDAFIIQNVVDDTKGGMIKKRPLH